MVFEEYTTGECNADKEGDIYIVCKHACPHVRYG